MDTETTSTIESKSDAELMKAIGRRESDAIQEIYKRYESTLRSVIQSVLHDEGETDDALNDVFLQLWDPLADLEASKLPARPSLTLGPTSDLPGTISGFT